MTRIGQVLVAGVARQHRLPLSRRSGDRGGTGIVLAGLGILITRRVVTELCEHPGAQHVPQTGTTADDLSDRVLTKTAPHHLLELIDLLGQVREHAGLPGHDDRVGLLDRSRLPQRRRPQRLPEAGGLGGAVTAPVRSREFCGDLPDGQSCCAGRIGGLLQQCQGVRGSELVERGQRGREVLA